MRRMLRLALLPLLLLCGLVSGLSASEQTVGTGDPLQVSVDDQLNVTTYRTETDTGNTQPTLDKQYYSTYDTFLLLTDASTSTASIYSGYGDSFVPESNTSSSSSIIGDDNNRVRAFPVGTSWTIQTVVSCATAVQVTHTLTYLSGTPQIQHTWVITNQGSSTYTGCALRYGGDTYFHDADEAVGFYDNSSGLLYCTSPDYTGFMGMQAGSGTPATGWYEDGYSEVWDALDSTSLGLPDTVNANYIDNGMGLEWDIGTLAPQASVTITCTELWDNAAAVSVTPPNPPQVVAGQPTPLTFTITNNESTSDTFALSANATTGITIDSIVPAGPIALGSGASTQVVVTVTASVDAVASGGSVNLQATSTSTPSDVNSATVILQLPPALVVGPGSLSIAPNGEQDITFSVTNLESDSDVFSVTVNSSSGLTVGAITSPQQYYSGFRRPRTLTQTDGPLISLAGNQATTVTVSVTAGAIFGSTDELQLVVASYYNLPTAPSGMASVAITITQPSSGVTASVPTVGLPVSTRGQSLFLPISPATPEGVANVLSVLAGAGQDAVAYAWDAQGQRYVQLPAQPPGGVQPTTGLFVASLVGLSFDVSGSVAEPPVAIPLQPGWNLIGIPPIDNGNQGGITTFTVPTSAGQSSNIALLDGSGNLITDIPTYVSTLGTVNSVDLTTAEPYLYNGSTYTQVATLTTGVAYWVKNNASTPVTLQVSLTGPALSSIRHPLDFVGSGDVGGYHDQGSPPTMPGAAAESDGSGSGCGLSSGTGLLILLTLAQWRRHRRRAERQR